MTNLLPKVMEQIILDTALTISASGSNGWPFLLRNCSTRASASSWILLSIERFPKPKSLMLWRANLRVCLQDPELVIIPELYNKACFLIKETIRICYLLSTARVFYFASNSTQNGQFSKMKFNNI